MRLCQNVFCLVDDSQMPVLKVYVCPASLRILPVLKMCLHPAPLQIGSGQFAHDMSSGRPLDSGVFEDLFAHPAFEQGKRVGSSHLFHGFRLFPRSFAAVDLIHTGFFVLGVLKTLCVCVCVRVHVCAHACMCMHVCACMCVCVCFVVFFEGVRGRVFFLFHLSSAQCW